MLRPNKASTCRSGLLAGQTCFFIYSEGRVDFIYLLKNIRVLSLTGGSLLLILKRGLGRGIFLMIFQ